MQFGSAPLPAGYVQHRYMRVVFPLGKNSIPRGRELNESTLPKAVIQNAVSISAGSISKRYAPVGRCIYCGATELRPGSGLRLSEEHIIAEGLGGNIILPEASCDKCATETGHLEGVILRSLLWAPRAQLGIRGKRRKRDFDTYPVKTQVNGKEIELRLPIGTHPTILLLCGFQPPRLLDPQHVDRPYVAGVWSHVFGDPSVLAREFGGESAVSPSFDTVRVAQMLAKIAHGFAVAELGATAFKPMLPEFISRQFATTEQYPEAFDLIGGDPTPYAPGEDLHTIGHHTVRQAGKDYEVVSIRLFANLGAPVYRVVVGELL